MGENMEIETLTELLNISGIKATEIIKEDPCFNWRNSKSASNLIRWDAKTGRW